MKLLPFIILLATILPVARSVAVRYDPEYDNRNVSLTAVACSDGKNGLITKGYKTFGDLPNFPYIGASNVVKGYNSASCGSCWELTTTTNTIYVIAIDRAGDGFNIAGMALEQLGGQEAIEAGKINAAAKRVAGSNCGL